MQSDKLKEDAEGLIERAEILKRWQVEDKTVLDIGAGPLATIAARDFHCTVTNIDISEDALRGAERDSESERITFEICDATSLSYPDRSFDVVISYAVLHHIEVDKRRKFIQEAYRVAKEKCIIAEFTSEGFDKIHTVSDFKAVDLEWLERELNLLGEVDKYSGALMKVYTLFLFTKENLC
jgi:ubiquinone/menaquinone biosynthesis C-methylase UbiE